ncbi:MAG TPA: serine/threonine protein kinase [Nocardioidaceae bacterium]|nr:serine/threonine protein kinase [Nocardioidaceae bacterium]
MSTQRYRLESRIATGGMGEVWRGSDTVLDRDVAVKVLKAEHADDPSFRSRFETEARHAAALHHPNVASVFDYGELPAEDGSGVPRPYLVMELVPGRPLSQLLRDRRMPPDTAANLVAQAADAIGAAHAAGVVHRDVKPANLLVTPEGTVKITDFGIARAGETTGLTQTGQIVGTPQYLSPEQAEGRPATPGSDLYSLGVVLYECLAGRRPFERQSPVGTALAHLREEPEPLPDDVPGHLRRVVTRALAKDPADRFGSAAEFAAALRGVGPAAEPATKVVTLAPVGPTSTTESSGSAAPRRRMPGWAPYAGAAVGVAAVIVLLALLGNGDGTPAHAPAAGASSPSSPSASPSRSPDNRVRVRRADYLGRPADQAASELTALGLSVRKVPVANTGDHEPGTVAQISPTGLVAPDRTVTLGVWGKPAPNGHDNPGSDKHGKNDHGNHPKKGEKD